MSLRRYGLTLPMVLGLGLALALFGLLNQHAAQTQTALDALHVSHSCDGIPNCYRFIQSALDVAKEGDVIRVARGVYTEPLVVRKSISLEGGWDEGFTVWNRETNVTTIDAQRNGPAVRVETRASPTIEGFVITGGDATSFDGRGGGIRVNEAGQVTIRYNLITDNIACDAETCRGQGGGIAVSDATAFIGSNTIVSNVAHLGENGEGNGGGVFVGSAASASVVGNDILSNTASLHGVGQGGGAFIFGPATLHDNQLRGNLASTFDDGAGGGIYAVQLQEAVGNTIMANEARRGGGVFLAASDHTPHLRYNLIARNRATGSGPEVEGGGGVASEDDDAEIINNQLISNTAAYLGGGLLLAGGTEYLVRQNVFQSNTAPFGGGVFVYASTGKVEHNWIISNTAVTRGGGLYLYADGVPQVDANRILGNAVTDGDGGGVCIRNSHTPVTLTNLIIAHNSASQDGDGMHVTLGTAIRLLNNTLVDNGSGTGTEGIALMENSHVTATNNILVGHGTGVLVAADSNAILDHNDYFDNGKNTDGVSWGPNHLTHDPLFVARVNSDYHLRPDSTLIDTGDSDVTVARDFEWDPRPSGVGIDVGADEISLRVYLALMLRR